MNHIVNKGWQESCNDTATFLFVKAMNNLNLERINENAPYQVIQVGESPCLLYFHTEFEVDYEIVIKSNNVLIPTGAYALDIINIEHQPSPGDPKFKKTLLAIVEEFFLQNNDVMLYVTETKDSKQAFRNRLFVRWFNTYKYRDRFFIKTAEGKMEGQMNFMAIISRKDNPNLRKAIEEFDETIAFLFD